MVFRVEIAGSIAVGKSTLCDGLQRHGFEIIRERLEENPFLNKEYNSKAARGFDVMMAFLLSKAAAVENYNGNEPCIVTDYAMITEYAYNDQHLEKLSPQGHRLCEQTIHMKRAQLDEPDVLVVLYCPVEEQLSRIKSRGRDFEKGIAADYLKTLNENIEYHLDLEIVEGTQVLRIDTSKLDLTKPEVIMIVSAFIEKAYEDKTGKPLFPSNDANGFVPPSPKP